MKAKLRRSVRGAAVLVLLVMMSVWPGAGFATDVGRGFPGLSDVEGSPATRETGVGPTDLLREFQSVPAPDLDRALRANDLVKARQLVPVSWAASERLFVSYLERAFAKADAIRGDPDARMLAGRWAEVHFRIVEYDFARAAVTTLDAADAVRRQQLVAAVRDYFVTLERLRVSTPPAGSQASERSPEEAQLASRQRTAEQQGIATQFLEVAERFRVLSFPRGELWTLRSMINLPSQPQPSQQTRAQRADKIADQLGDELSLVAKRPFTEASLAMAERLGLVTRQVTILRELAVSGPSKPDTARREVAAKYLERARVLSRSIPPIESVNYWLFPSAAPQSARAILPQLWSIYHALKRPADAQPLVAEALEISRPFGERATTATLTEFASRAPGLSWDVAAGLLEVSRRYGERAEAATLAVLPTSIRTAEPGWEDAAGRLLDATTDLLTARQLGNAAALTSRAAVFEKARAQALALAVATADPHEQAVTLEWYARRTLEFLNRTRQTTGEPSPGDAAPLFPPAYRRLRELCLASNEFELTASALADEADVQSRFGDRALSTDVYKQAIELAERAGNPLKVAQIANRGAHPMGSPSLAARREFAARAAAAARQADNLLELAKALRESAQTVEEAQEAVAAAARYTEQSGSPNEELQSLDHLATLYSSRGDYQAAVETHLRRAERARGAKTPQIPSALTAYDRVVKIHLDTGEPSLAREAADRARELVESRVLGAESRPRAIEVWRALERLGEMAVALGEPIAAVEYWNAALQKMKEATPTEFNAAQQSRRQILERRATLYAQLGDFEAALRDWAEVLPLIKPTMRYFSGFSDVGHMVAWKAAVAWTHALAGNLDKALALTREAIAELGQDTSGLWAGQWFDDQSAEDRLLGILILANRAEEAIPLLEGLLRAPLINQSRERHLLGLLARAHARVKQFDKARALLVTAAEIERRGPTGGRWWARGLGDSRLALGMLELEAGNLAAALERLHEARDAVNPYDVDWVWQIERALGLAETRTGDIAAAAPHYEKALAVLESIRERRRPEESRLRYGVDRSLVYEEYAEFMAARALSTGQQADAERAFQAAERKRAQTLWSLLTAGWSRIPAASLPDQMRRLMDADSRLSAKQAILREQFDRPLEQRDMALTEKLQTDVEQIRGDLAQLLASIAQSRYRYAAPERLAASLAAPVRAALGPSRALIEYLVTEKRSYAFVVSPAGVKLVPLAVGRASLRDQVARLLAPFRELRAGTVDLARLEFDTRTAHGLYRAIFTPVVPHLGRVTELVIVPDDVLNQLPFEVLVERVPRPGAPGGAVHAELVDAPFLLRRYAISYLPSSAQLVSSGSAATPASVPRRLFAMANPTAGEPPPPAAVADPLTRQLRSPGFDVYFAPLPGADAEVKRIARYFAAGASTVVTGSLATEAVYKTQAGEASVVHFATHAVASDSQPLYSTLILAPDAKAADDGFLQAFEVLRTPLRADLVVLSGCETAVGSEDWGQGLVGLAAAFEQAGARSVLATLWSIDESTADVMAAFYRAMAQGSSTTVALRQAKLQLMQRRVRLGNVDLSLAHPFFWAPFKLMGVPAK